MKMKMILFLAVCCLALNNGMGAPRTAVYNFIRCNPEGDQANCVTYQSPEMEWSEDLPKKLPPSTAQYLEAEPVEDERQPTEESEEQEETSMLSEEGESPMVFLPEEGSGGYEGSAYESPYMADQATEAADGETGSGETWAKDDFKLYKGGRGNSRRMMKLFPSLSLRGESQPAEQELKDDHLLQL